MMNIRLVIGLVVTLLLCPFAFGRQVAPTDNSPKQQILRRIAVSEAALQQRESAHADNAVLGKGYIQLGLWYEDAGLWNKAEADLEHAAALFRHSSGSNGDLAEAIGALGRLHVVTGAYSESEKEEQVALKIRKSLRDQLQIARSWDDLAALYLAQHKYAKARDFARQAVTEFVADARAESFDRVSARYTLSLALCYLKDYSSALPVVRTAVDEAKATLQPDELPVGFGEFLMGYVYWQSGDLAKAGGHMERGKAAIGERLGWEHSTYLDVSKQYARFLRENHQVEDAEVVERQIRQAEAAVDVRSLQTQKGAFSFAGLK
jgi:tetratricopeptide (TPR) repeat protein